MTAQRMSFAAAVGTTVLSMMTVDSGSAIVVYAAGDLDMDTTDQFRRHLGEAVATYAPAVLVVDLEDLGFLGAAGVGALLACLDVVERSGGHLRLRHPSHPALIALRATRTLDLFDVEHEPGAG